MRKAIVTGANGFIGQWLIRELSAAGVPVTAVVKDDQEDVTCICDLPGVQIVTCELDDIASLARKVPEGDADIFYHLAWAGSTGPARADYTLQLQNVRWTLDAANAAKKIGCTRFVGAGTLAEFDCNAYIPADGSTPNAVSCYGAAKISAHYMSKIECNRLGLEHVWAYLSNTYGVGNRTQNFVNFASKTMITGKSADFTPGEQPYDFVYVSDIAQALYRMGEKGRLNYAYYIGSTKPDKLKNFIVKIRDAIDPSIELHLGAVPFNGIPLPAEVFDCTQLVEDTGYAPRVPFEQGIQQTVAWLREQIKEGKL